jgi:hypothetical protein
MSRPIRVINLGVEAVSGSTGYVLVDLSDTTGFKHVGTTEVHLLGLSLNGEKASDGVYDIWVGPVIRVDGTNGDTKWAHVFHLEAVGNPTDSTDRFAQVVDFTLGGANPEGINLNVTAGALPFYITNQGLTNSTVYQTDTNLTNPAGTTGAPAVGDLVVYVEEVSGTGTIDFSLTAIYYTA